MVIEAKFAGPRRSFEAGRCMCSRHSPRIDPRKRRSGRMGVPSEVDGPLNVDRTGSQIARRTKIGIER